MSEQTGPAAPVNTADLRRVIDNSFTYTDWHHIARLGHEAADEIDRLRAQLAQRWEPTGWWRTTLPDGTLWTESSNEAEVREHRGRTDQPTTLWRHERCVAQRWVVVEEASDV